MPGLSVLRARPGLRPLLALLAVAALVAGLMSTVDSRQAAASHAPVSSPLQADAGSSVAVRPGAFATFIGSAYGGSEPYRFAWSSVATADGKVADSKLQHRREPTATVDTEGLRPGSYQLRLTVTDAAGRSDSDVVNFVVQGADTATLFNETRPDTEPGVTGTGSKLTFPFEVPAGYSRLEVSLKWENLANDYDLRVLDPSGREAASSGNAPPAFEDTAVTDPQPGTWTVVADRYLTVGDPGVTATVVGRKEGAQVLPDIDAGGPYRFVDGATQQLTGTVGGGAAPLSVGWDTNLDGIVDRSGARITTTLPLGRHLVVMHARDANGLEVQEMTSVLVGSHERVRQETVPFTVIGLADSGINPYHEELSAATYPDAEVLEITRNFTRHPSEYIPGYPKDAEALPITLGQGYFPAQDRPLWNGNNFIEAGKLYWIPGTKIIGAIDAGGSTGATSGADSHPILDDNGHGTGSSTVSTGNRYGYCPTCLLVNVEALDETVVAKYDWIDISSNSFGYIGGLPIGYVAGPSEITKASAERGQTTLFAAGNGVGNAFDVPILTYGSDQTGPDWNITVGAIREDNGEAITGDGVPVHLSALGDGNLPSACRVGTNTQCAFGGTSAATPYTAGVFGTTLTNVRDALGDWRTGQQANQVIAKGDAITGSRYLGDGQLTRRELRAAVLKNAAPLDISIDPNKYPYPATYEGPQVREAIEGYGAASPNAASRATAVLLGQRPMPARPSYDAFFAEDCQARDDQYGSYDRDGDGQADGCAKSESVDPTFKGSGQLSTAPAPPGVAAYDPARPAIGQPYGDRSRVTYWLHRVNDQEPDVEADQGCAASFNASFMDHVNRANDNDPCFESRITSTIAGFRPKGIFAAADTLSAPLPKGTRVTADVYMASSEAAVVDLRGVLVATDREVGRGGDTEPVVASGGRAGCQTLGEACWSRFQFSFRTERHVAAGEQLTFQIQEDGAREFAFGYEDGHASKIHIDPAALPSNGLDFGVNVKQIERQSSSVRLHGQVAFPRLGADPQQAGFHPTTELVQVAVNDPRFRSPSYAVIDRTAGEWTAQVGGLEPGTSYTLYVRALRDGFPSPTVRRTFTTAD